MQTLSLVQKREHCRDVTLKPLKCCTWWSVFSWTWLLFHKWGFISCRFIEYFFYKIIKIYVKKLIYWGQSWRSGTNCDCNTDWLWVRSSLEEMKYLLKFIFTFLRSGVGVERGVEFCHSTRNASRIWQKVWNGVS